MPATIVVEGVEIPEFLIADEVQNHPSLSAAEARTAAGKALAVKALLLHRADELGLRAEPLIDEAGREETAEEALIRATLDAEVKIEPPSTAECRRVYDAQRARFTTPALIEAAHILIEPKTDDADGWAAALRTAQDALAQVTVQPAAFAALAKALSDCPSGQVGGSLGQLGPGDVVGEIETALAGLRPGEVLARPVRSRFGWHLLKLDRRMEGRELPFDYVEDKIRLHLESRAWTAAATRYVSDLADRARAQGVAFSLSRDGRFASGSLSLGEMLADGASAEALEGWLDATDPELAGRVRAAALAAEQEVAAFVRRAVAHFVDNADDESWTQLISASQGATDPAIAAMAALLKTKLTPKARSYTLVSRR
ncbi:peptidylprolyl isomerase [Phenylobacterium aquaticum]|uniref:peptidylprolyl isomerase n=1 Tax=Phenylobacterium aquaticum TaxID=1763816 RepID=UPI001F5D9A01|nr:peptidylprolyl isomerase [Phenylobacterium aquaticum]MCI3135323.1 peptidylprolyl isomerase [Phenylobacterium aquaticum]